MPPHLENLPTELLATIFGLLPQDGSRLALASTSTHLRDVLVPHIFRAVKLISSTQEQHKFEQLVNKYSPAITYLHFVVSMPHGVPEVDILATPTDHRVHEQDIPISTEGNTDTGAGNQSLMTDFACDALTGRLLPKVTTLCLSFDFDFDYDGEKPGEGSNVWDDPSSIAVEFSTSIWIFTDEEAAEDVPMKEAKYPWRALDVETTTFDSDDWRSFLGRLDTLELSIWGDSSELGLHALEGHTNFGCKLGKYFFQHLTKVQQLLLVAYPDCPFGRDFGDNLVQDVFLDWALSKEHLPHLRLLELRNVFVNKKLADFILNRSATLHHVRLHDCHCESDVNFPNTEMFSWAMFFTHLDHNKTQLKELHVTYEQGDAAMLHDSEENQLRKENEEDMVFSYGYMYANTEYGFMLDDEAIREKYEERMDLVAYRRLMDTTRQNRGNASREWEV
ncbi:hypothetical protein PM082_003784 [Marasmius tenuissimus]|nr:hypothetical protein PM082_003784 [Marasmius tenuissimus]